MLLAILFIVVLLGCFAPVVGMALRLTAALLRVLWGPLMMTVPLVIAMGYAVGALVFWMMWFFDRDAAKRALDRSRFVGREKALLGTPSRHSLLCRHSRGAG